MTIKTLETVPITLLAAVFNEAFSDYVIPFSLSETDLKAKIAAENIRLDCSVGVFLKNKPIGFYFGGSRHHRQKTHRIQCRNRCNSQMPRATPNQAMYDYLLPLLQLKGISHHLLEVITHNEKAIHIYNWF
jgi:hypothetical protein